MAKEPKPPYLSVRGLDKVIELVSNRNLGNVSAETFSKYEFNEGDATIAASALRFLGVIDDSGNPTQIMQKLHLRGDARKEVFEDILRNGYKKIFDVAGETAHTLPDDQLLNELTIQYDLSPRVARTALPAFKRIAQLAGLLDEKAVLTRTKSTKPLEKKTAANIKAAKKVIAKNNSITSHDESFTEKSLEEKKQQHTQLILKGKVSITIPEDWNTNTLLSDELADLWRAALKATNLYAKKYEESFPENLEEGVPSEEET